MKKFAIIVAGGSGTRMGSAIPKQFLTLAGKPVLMHTISVFKAFDPDCNLIVVLPESQLEFWHSLCLKHAFTTAHQLVSGGQTRFHSVLNGLNLIDDSDSVVFIHDGVRPLVSQRTLKNCFETALHSGNAIPVLPVVESLRKIEGDLSVSVDRSVYLNVQTPQTFLSGQIREAYAQAYTPAFTDDASVCEMAGFRINLVEGNPANIKITTPEDLIFAEALLQNNATSGETD